MESSIHSLKLRLEHITSAAQRIKSSAQLALCKAGREPLATNTAPAPAIRNLYLPIPEEITVLLGDSGCPAGAAGPLSDAFIRSARKLRDMYQTTYRQICQRMARNSCSDQSRLVSQFDRLGSSMETQYRQRVIAAQQLAVDQVRKNHRNTRSKPAFNQEFVPLFEKYFEYNAYPSAPDRAALARKSMMTLRQIEVWFQNHRNRAKKEGKVLRRLTSDPLPLQLSLESLEKKMPFFVIPEHERERSAQSSTIDLVDHSEEEDLRWTNKLNATVEFSTVAPTHAYPTTYPVSCTYNPFPRKLTQNTLPSPTWIRKPAISLPCRTPVDFDDFVSDFAAKLALRESSQRNNKLRMNIPAHTSTCPWFASTLTITPPAPHPALIRPSTFVCVPTAADLLPAVSAPPSRLHPFRSPSPTSRRITLVPNSLDDNLAHRKVARLPKRIPKHPSMAHRSASPTASEGSLSPSPSSRTLSSGSRTPSFSSDTSSDSRPSSSSGHSSSSSAPTTPELASTQLPPNVMSVSISGVEFESERDFFSFSDSYSCMQLDLHTGK